MYFLTWIYHALVFEWTIRLASGQDCFKDIFHVAISFVRFPKTVHGIDDVSYVTHFAALKSSDLNKKKFYIWCKNKSIHWDISLSSAMPG